MASLSDPVDLGLLDNSRLWEEGQTAYLHVYFFIWLSVVIQVACGLLVASTELTECPKCSYQSSLSSEKTFLSTLIRINSVGGSLHAMGGSLHVVVKSLSHSPGLGEQDKILPLLHGILAL